MSASANGWHGAPIKAPHEAKTGRLGKEGNEEWRPRAPVPFGLLPKVPGASLLAPPGTRRWLDSRLAWSGFRGTLPDGRDEAAAFEAQPMTAAKRRYFRYTTLA
jgi:hypothetical protein